jgi:hypothetical protein
MKLAKNPSTLSNMSSHRARLLVVSSPLSPELALLETLPKDVEVVGIGQNAHAFGHLSVHQWDSIGRIIMRLMMNVSFIE